MTTICPQPTPDTYVPDAPCPTGTPTIGVPDFPPLPPELVETGLSATVAAIGWAGLVLVIGGLVYLFARHIIFTRAEREDARALALPGDTVNWEDLTPAQQDAERALSSESEFYPYFDLGYCRGCGEEGAIIDSRGVHITCEGEIDTSIEPDGRDR